MRKSGCSHGRKNRMSPISSTRENARKLSENDVIRATIGPAAQRGRVGIHQITGRSGPPDKATGLAIFGLNSPIRPPRFYLPAFRAFLRPRERAAPNGQRKRRAQSAPPDSGGRTPLRPLHMRRYCRVGRIVSNIERRGRRAGPTLYPQPIQSAHMPYAARIARQ